MKKQKHKQKPAFEWAAFLETRPPLTNIVIGRRLSARPHTDELSVGFFDVCILRTAETEQ